MRANDKLIHLNESLLNQVTIMKSSEANEMITKELAEECAKKIEELNSMTWTITTASNCDTYTTANYNTSNAWTGLKTFDETCKEYDLYSKEKEDDQKEIEQKERVDNIMNKYGLI